MSFRQQAERLSAHGQQHVLHFFDQLAAEQQQSLLQQLEALDLDWLDRAIATEIEATDPSLISCYEQVIKPGDPREAEALDRGKKALEQGRVGTLLVAGGAGTRLGFDGPKGAFPLGAISGNTLFQMHAERLVGLGRRYGVIPPLYLMTSPANHEETCRFFAEHDRFGMPAERVLIFPQGQAPAVDERGKLLLESAHSLVLTANGNGGLFAAMRDGGAFAHMHDVGVETISYIQIDNPLALSCDPLFTGYHLQAECQLSCKAIAKTGPFERVGNYARVGGRLGIVEYTEIPEALATEKDAAGELLYGYGNPGLFNWSREYAEQSAAAELPVHKAHKKIAHIDESGARVEPSAPNGYKLETFALDTLLTAERTIVMACDRDAEFAPVKNASGTDSPESAQGLMTALFRNWITAAGGTVADGIRIEIDPGYAIDAAELAERLPGGFTADSDLHLK